MGAAVNWQEGSGPRRCALVLGSILALAAFGVEPVLAQGGDFKQPATSQEAAGDRPASVAGGDFNRDAPGPGCGIRAPVEAPSSPASGLAR